MDALNTRYNLRIACVGLGYVGLPVACTFAEAGFEVVGIDIDPVRLDEIASGLVDEVPVLSGVLASGRLQLTVDPAGLADADVVFICVPTPREPASPDGTRHERVREAARAFAAHGRPDALVILESTVQPGFVRTLRPLLGHGGQVALAYAPERVDPYRDLRGEKLREIPRLVSGVDEDARERARAVLHAAGMTTYATSVKVTEYAKLLENAYRLVNIAFIDEFAHLCREDGVDAHEVVRAAATKPFGFQPFFPGVGAGGHCVPIDPTFLAGHAEATGSPMALLTHALHLNADQPVRLAERLSGLTGEHDVVFIVGLTYKASVSDIRESAAVTVARTLQRMGRRVLTHDALVGPVSGLPFVSMDEGLERADVVLYLVDQPRPVRARLSSTKLPVYDVTGELPTARSV